MCHPSIYLIIPLILLISFGCLHAKPENITSKSIVNKQCIDMKNNLIIGSSPTEHPKEVMIKDLSGVVYTSTKKPSCYDGRPSVVMPGLTKLLSGKLTVPRQYDLLSSGTIRMTVHNPNYQDPLCLVGVSQYAVMPTKFCSFNLCEFIGKDICEFLQTPGTHTIQEMEDKISFNSTQTLPEPPSLLGISLLDLFSGEFRFRFSLEVEGKIILELDIPTNEKYLQIGVSPEEPEEEDKKD
uniref:Uncharacterized protein n=1 Tax=Ditylenchus dipsaci TaxID=166011 RepID=A0A915DII1_9BILA